MKLNVPAAVGMPLEYPGGQIQIDTRREESEEDGPVYVRGKSPRSAQRSRVRSADSTGLSGVFVVIVNGVSTTIVKS